ncbi:MAG: primosomal protein N' [Anaerolineales bacterium]
MYVEVAVNLAGPRGSFHYHLPDNTELADLEPGHLITVPFAGRRAQAVVLARDQHSPVEETKPVEGLIDPEPVLTKAQIELARWMADYYHASLADCVHLMIPSGLSQRTDSLYSLEDSDHAPQGKVEARLLDQLKRRGPLRRRQLQRSLSRMNWQRAADRLVDRGVLSRRWVLQPPKVSARHVRTARLALPPEQAQAAFPDVGTTEATLDRRQKILRALINEGEPLEVTWVYAQSGGHLRDLRVLEEKGLVALSEAEVWRDPLEHVEYVPREAPPLTEDQALTWFHIQEELDAPSPKPILLHGVTGSGKTELYLRAVAEVIKSGQQAIVLVPEIALTPQTVRRFLARFPGQVGLIHSQLSEGERYDTWRRARTGSLPIIVGPRSALFTPLPDIGLIVLDESHDESYKEEHRAPRYHARQTAVAYAHRLNALCLFGSATPDVVSRHQSEKDTWIYLPLPKRIMGHRERIERQAERLKVTPKYQAEAGQAQSIPMPQVSVVDMRRELRAGNTSVFSRPLQRALQEVIEADQQAILFLNRRGTNTHVFCRDCGWVARCPRCDRPFTFHGSSQTLLCHHCGYRRANPESCPDCGGERVRHFGAGTQRIEEDLKQMLPGASTIRWDHDTTQKKGAHEIILSHFQAQRAQVLVGTQMVAKGLDLPMVTLVGVVSADTGINLPDFRAAERTFQLLTQVAGRAGRGLLGGRVILQTYHPDHYAIQAASQHDYQQFYHRELQERQRLDYPPFQRLARLVFRHSSNARAEKEARSMLERLLPSLESAGLADQLIGPVPCFFQKERGEFRWQLVMRAPDPSRYLPEALPAGWTLDIDPVSLL